MGNVQLSSKLASKHRWLQTWFSPLLLAGAALYLFVYYVVDNRLIESLYVGVNGLIVAYIVHRRGRSFQQLYYDAHYLYRIERGQEEVIPLEAIKKVELKTFFGGYQIDFYPRRYRQATLLFLPSALYPLNFRSQDRRIQKFRETIYRAKNQDYPTSAQLGSTTSSA